MLSSYFKHAGKFKLLTREEEVELSKRIEAGDKKAYQKMAESNLRLAINVAKKFYRPGRSMEDLIQESNIGLLKAIEKFDWRKGFRFSTYATWWITQAVRRYVSDSNVIRIPAHAKGAHVKIRIFKEEYREKFGCYPTDEEVAECLKISVKMIKDLRSGPKSIISIDKPIGESGNTSIGDLIPDDNASPEKGLMETANHKMIQAAFNTLTDREEKIIRLRFGLSHDDHDHDSFPISQEELDMLEKGEE